MSDAIEEVEVITAEPATSWTSMPFNERLGKLRGDIYEEDVYQSWHQTQQGKFVLHPCVRYMVNEHKPKDYQKLALEYPHASATDTTRIAYTRSITDGIADRQLVTSVGKYLSRHWPEVPDHVRRDAQALFTPDHMYFVHTVEEFIQAVECGPRSCMASIYGSIEFDRDDHARMLRWFKNKQLTEPPWHTHPYSSYLPENGWSMALRRGNTGNIDGRALVLEFGGTKQFVRTYRRHLTDPTGWSDADHSLHAWLIHAGYTHVSEWPVGAKWYTPEFEDSDDIRGPYIDGDNRSVYYNPDTQTSTLCYRSNRTHWFENTNGKNIEGDYSHDDEHDADDDDDQDRETCEACDGSFHCDDMTWVGRNNETHVCDRCQADDFIEVRGAVRSGHNGAYSRYYINNNDAVEVKGRHYWIDPEWPPESVVELENGDWAREDDVVCIGGDYYLDDDPEVIKLAEEDPDTGDNYGLKNDCYKSADGEWFASEDHYLECRPSEEEEDGAEEIAEDLNEEFEMELAPTPKLQFSNMYSIVMTPRLQPY